MMKLSVFITPLFPSFVGAPTVNMNLWNGVSAKDIDGKVVQLESIAKKVTLVTNGNTFSNMLYQPFFSHQVICTDQV